MEMRKDTGLQQVSAEGSSTEVAVLGQGFPNQVISRSSSAPLCTQIDGCIEI